MALDFLNDIWGAINPTQGTNALGWLAGAGDLFKLGAGINNQFRQSAAEDQYKQLQSRGPRVQDYYKPMSDAESQGYLRGIGANAQQNIPPQSAAFNDLLGNSLASRESQRYQDAYRQAFADWQQRLGGRSNIYGQTGAQLQNQGGLGQGLSQFLLYKQLMDAANRGSQTGQTYNPAQVGQQFMPDPYGYGGGIPQGTFGAGSLQDPTQRGGASPLASGQFTDTNDSNPSFFGGAY